MTSSGNPHPIQIDAYTAESANQSLLPRTVAAVSLVAGAWLLLTGRRTAALAAVAAGAAAVVAEKPEVVREIWRNTPDYIRTGQDFLVKAERTVDDLRSKGERLRAMMSRT